MTTVDGEPFSVEKARSLARGVWLAGFALLPMAWAANCWLWWPHAKGGPGADPVVRMYARRSGACAALFTAALLPWTLCFMIGGPSVVGQRAFDALDVRKVDLGLG